MSGRAAVGVHLGVITIPYIFKCPIVFKANSHILSATIGWIMLKKKMKKKENKSQYLKTTKFHFSLLVYIY